MDEYSEYYELICHDPIMGTETIVKGKALTYLELQDVVHRFLHAVGYTYVQEVKFITEDCVYDATDTGMDKGKIEGATNWWT